MRHRRWRPLAIGAVIYVAAVLLLIRLETDQGGVSAAIDVIGKTETVFDWSSQACDPEHFPDLPVRAFRDYRGRVQLILPHYVTRRMIGPSLNSVHVDCAVTLRSPQNPDPAAFDDQEWLASVFTQDGRNIAALVHEEYHGHQHPGRCPSGVYKPCWYNAITFARSTDGGRSFDQPLPPEELIASSPRRYTPRRRPLRPLRPHATSSATRTMASTTRSY